jgi:hypothetical protein
MGEAQNRQKQTNKTTAQNKQKQIKQSRFIEG